MNVRVLLLSAWLIAAVPAWPVRAQTYFPDTITFSGATQSQDQLLAFTGLHAGRVTKDEMQTASDRLAGTGLFADVRYTLKDDVLQFTLIPSPAVLPVRYDNFPWWDDKTLNGLIAEKVPLFGGALYPGGPMRQQVIDVLEALLADKGIKAKVSTSPMADAGGTMIATRYHIDSPPMAIASLTIEGASDAFAAEMRRVEESAAGKDFRAATRDSIAGEIRSVYAKHGLLDVSLAGPAWGVPKVVDGKILVPLTATIGSEGSVYTVASVRFDGDKMTTPSYFATHAKIRPGDIADNERVDEALAVLTAPWKENGYPEAKAEAGRVLDNAQHTVAYTFRVNPGPMYRMGRLTLVGLDKRQEREVRRYWELPEGAVFQENVPPRWRGRYVNARADQLAVQERLRRMVEMYEYHAQPQTHTVDVVVTFRDPKAGENPWDYHPTWR